MLRSCLPCVVMESSSPAIGHPLLVQQCSPSAKSHLRVGHCGACQSTRQPPGTLEGGRRSKPAVQASASALEVGALRMCSGAGETSSNMGCRPRTQRKGKSGRWEAAPALPPWTPASVPSCFSLMQTFTRKSLVKFHSRFQIKQG